MADIFVDKDLKERFIEYLKREGYPDCRIATDWGDGSFCVDIAILAEDLKTPLSLYEVKQAISVGESRRILERVGSYLKRAGLTLPIYIVFPDSELKGQFEIMNLTETLYNPSELVDIDELSTSKNVQSYKLLENGAKSKIEMQSQIKLKKKMDSLKLICWLVIPITALIVLVLDAFGVYQLNSERLISLGLIILVALIPFFSEISLGDFSVKTKKEEKNKQ